MTLTPVTLSRYDYGYASDLALYGHAEIPFPRPDLDTCSAFLVDFTEDIEGYTGDERWTRAVVIVTRHPSYGATVGAYGVEKSSTEPATDGMEAWSAMEREQRIATPDTLDNTDVAQRFLDATGLSEWVR